MKLEPAPGFVRTLLDLEVGESGYHIVYDGEDPRLIAKRLRSTYGQHGRRYGRNKKFRVLVFIQKKPITIKGNPVIAVTRLR